MIMDRIINKNITLFDTSSFVTLYDPTGWVNVWPMVSERGECPLDWVTSCDANVRGLILDRKEWVLTNGQEHGFLSYCCLSEWTIRVTSFVTNSWVVWISCDLHSWLTKLLIRGWYICSLVICSFVSFLHFFLPFNIWARFLLLIIFLSFSSFISLFLFLYFFLLLALLLH